MAAMNRLTSAATVNEEQRKIARDMDDIKQRERTIAETPKQRRIAAMADGAEHGRGAVARHDTSRVTRR
jgi:hypothetical protein